MRKTIPIITLISLVVLTSGCISNGTEKIEIRDHNEQIFIDQPEHEEVELRIDGRELHVNVSERTNVAKVKLTGINNKFYVHNRTEIWEKAHKGLNNSIELK